MRVHLEPRTVLNLHGPPMVGKSVLALHIAGELSKEGRPVVLASEPSYEEPRYIKVVEEACGYMPEVKHVKTFGQAMAVLREVREGALVADSVSALADEEAPTGSRGLISAMFTAGSIASHLKRAPPGSASADSRSGKINAHMLRNA